ncbi:hypothetical protein [Streptomyces sp. NPDC047070]|uniref:hypothetical protein n=1 Tax=Streptomyces sp. NPDC047070 TaxID=3154923 RepID=UPI003456656C
MTHPTAQPDAPLTAGAQISASGNQYSTVYQAVGDINLHEHPTLSTLAVTEAEINAVRRAWVKVDQRGHPLTTAPRVLELLRQDEPIVVISARRGTGKTAAALKALTDFILERSTPGPAPAPLLLEHVLPDWDAPDKDLLPREPGRGYLLDVSGEHWSDSVTAAKQILGHANVLRQKGSRLIVLTGEAAWPAGRDPEMGRVSVAATAAPRGDLVLQRHIKALYPDPAQHGWLHAATGEHGGLADLLRPDMPPADAASLAVALSRIDGTEPGALGTARATMLGWHDLVRTTFTSTEGKADDRALLLAAIILDGHNQGDVLKAARRLLRQDEARNISDILTAPGLATRLENVQAKVDGQRVSFRHLPGYPAAVLRYAWRQLSDVQQPMLDWIQQLTAPRGLAALRIDPIAQLLVDLAVTENDLKPLDIAHAWANSGTQGHQAAAAMLATAAQNTNLGADVRARLRSWANGAEGTATVSAVACQGEFAALYPRQALTCLRWVLDRPHRDSAVTAAEHALRAMASHVRLLPQVWEAVTSWTTTTEDDKGYRAGRRAFIALLTPHAEPASPAGLLLANALTDPATADDLVNGWCAVLAEPAFDEPAETLLTEWAQAVADAVIDSDAVIHVLDRVIDEHLMTGPMAAFLMGRSGPTTTPPAVVELRKRLMLSYRHTTPDTSTPAQTQPEETAQHTDSPSPRPATAGSHAPLLALAEPAGPPLAAAEPDPGEPSIPAALGLGTSSANGARRESP